MALFARPFFIPHHFVRGHPKLKTMMSVDLNKSVSAGPLCFEKTRLRSSASWGVGGDYVHGPSVLISQVLSLPVNVDV